MTDEVEVDFTFHGIRSMESLPPGAMLICDADSKPCAIYSPDKGWRAVSEEAFQRAAQVVLSAEGMAEIARRVSQSMRSDKAASDE